MTKLLWQDTSILQNADLTSYVEHEWTFLSELYTISILAFWGAKH